jgi:transcriptional regulator with XRE-family HTH domain
MTKKEIHSTHPIDPKQLKAAVRELRTEVGDTQQEFAHRLHAAIRSVARYETDRPPRGTILLKLWRLAKLKRLDVVSNVFREAIAAELADPELQRALVAAIEKDLRAGFEKTAGKVSNQKAIDLGLRDDEERAGKAAVEIMRTCAPADRQLFIDSLQDIDAFKRLLRRAALMLDLEQKLVAEAGSKDTVAVE